MSFDGTKKKTRKERTQTSTVEKTVRPFYSSGSKQTHQSNKGGKGGLSAAGGAFFV